MPAGSLVAPMVPPLMVTVPGELVMSMPSPVWPSRSTLPMVSDPDMPLRLMPSAPPLEVTEARVAFSVVGLISSAVPLLEVIWLVPFGIGQVDGAGALGPETERTGAVDGDVDPAVEAVGAGVGQQVDAVAVGAAGVVEDGDQAGEGGAGRRVGDGDRRRRWRR